MKNFWNDPRMSFWNLEQAEALDTPSFTPFPLSSDFEVISSSFGKDVNWFLLAASSSVERSILIDRFFKNILSYFCLHNNVFLIWAEFVFIFVLISIIFETIMEVPCCVFGSVGPHITPSQEGVLSFPLSYICGDHVVFVYLCCIFTEWGGAIFSSFIYVGIMLYCVFVLYFYRGRAIFSSFIYVRIM